MTDERYDECICRAAEFYGWEAQSRQAIEEMAELTKAINKYWRLEKGLLPRGKTKNNRAEDFIDSILEEMVDVRIVLNEMQYLLDLYCDGVSERLSEIEERKCEREMNRIDELEERRNL